MILRALLAAFLAAAASFPQSLGELLEKAPPDTDKALREVITKFYQAHMDGKFRAADEFVAEDSKDVFFAMEKRRCRSFEIVTLKYSDQFTRARAVVNCDTDITLAMAGKVAVKLPELTLWKIVDGRWRWYVDPPDPRGTQTPFGWMKPGPEPAAGPPPAVNPVSVEAVTKLVRADKNSVRLESSNGWTDRLVVTNNLPGAVSLSVEGAAVSGLQASFDRTNLAASESATLTVRFQPDGGQWPSEAGAEIVVSPTQQTIPFKIYFGQTVPVTPGR